MWYHLKHSLNQQVKGVTYISQYRIYVIATYFLSNMHLIICILNACYLFLFCRGIGVHKISIWIFKKKPIWAVINLHVHVAPSHFLYYTRDLSINSVLRPLRTLRSFLQSKGFSLWGIVQMMQTFTSYIVGKCLIKYPFYKTIK